MKYLLKITSIFPLLALFVATAHSQAPTGNIPRTGNTVGADNTYRVLNYIYDSLPADKAGLDTIYVAPYGFHTQVFVSTVRDSFALDVPSTTNSFKGDELEVQIVNGANGVCIRFAGPYMAPANTGRGGTGGTIYLTPNNRASIIFHFDGSKWVEVSRMAQ